MFVNFNILNQLGSPAINSNTFANRPAAGQTGRLFVSTDTFEIYRDNGTTWDLIGGPGTSTITGTGTATQVAFFTSSQAIGSNANLYWDNVNERLGIGTIAPSSKLDIAGNNTLLHLKGGSNAYMMYHDSGVDEYKVGYTGTGGPNYRRWSIYDESGAKEVLTIDKQSRFVGINYQYSSLADQPAYTLDVSGSLRITDSAYFATNAGNRVGIGTTSPQYPLDVVTPNSTAIAIVTTRETANGPAYFVGRCIDGTYASPTDQVTFGAIFQSYGYRNNAYREHGYITFSGVNATTGNGIKGDWSLFLSNDSSVITQIAQASALSFNIGGNYLQTTYTLQVTGQSNFNAGLGQLAANVTNTTTAASGVTGYGLLISSEATASTSYALHLINGNGSVSYGGVSTVTGQVGYWSIGFAATGTIGNRLTVSGAMSVGSSSYLTTAAPSNGAMIEGNTLIGTTTNSGEKLQVNGTVKTTDIITVDTTFPRVALKRASSTAQADIAFIDGANTKWSMGQAVITVGNNLDFYAYATSKGVLVLKESGVVNMPNLPTSSTGLSAGDLWNNSGVINIV